MRRMWKFEMCEQMDVGVASLADVLDIDDLFVCDSIAIGSSCDILDCSSWMDWIGGIAWPMCAP